MTMVCTPGAVMGPEMADPELRNRPAPYYDHAGITIYHGDCREILPHLPKVDAVITDPPYGIGRAKGMGEGGFSHLTGKARYSTKYVGSWDRERPTGEVFDQVLAAASISIIWGGNYFADILPASSKWLIWDKCQTMPSYSDAEIAWTNLGGNSTKMFRLNGNGMLAAERNRVHPTQKPLRLMKWCLGFVPNAKAILDPFMGSGTTLVAAKQLGLSAVGIEREEKYCEIATKRLAQEVMTF